MEITLQYVDERIMKRLQGIVDVEWREIDQLINFWDRYRGRQIQIGGPCYVPANAQEVQANQQAVQYQWYPH